MVSKSDYLSNLFSKKAGLTEAILLPYFTMLELFRVSELNRATRNIFLPQSYHHINHFKVLCAALEIDENSLE